MTGRPFDTLLVYVLLFTTCSVRTEIYESIHWSPRNPKFKFTGDQFKNEVAYYRKSVVLTSKISFVCPNPTTVFGTITTNTAKEELNENLWIVDKSSFDSCNIDRNKKENKLLLQCLWKSDSDTLQYKPIVFLQYSATDGGLQFQPGQEYYLIATSDGLESSVNSTAGGHCRDMRKGISMRVIFYICRNTSECNFNATTYPPPPHAAADGRSSPSEIMQYLAIAFGVAFALSVLVIVILFICCISAPRNSSLPRGATKRTGRHLNNSKAGDKNLKKPQGPPPSIPKSQRDAPKAPAMARV